MKKLLSIMLAILMVVTTVPYAFAAATVASGTCGADGSNVSWELDSDGVLTFSGEGATQDYPGPSHSPIYYYKDDVKKIVVNDGVTRLGTYVCFMFTEVTEVSLPESLVSIGENVFAYFKALESIELPDNLTTIGIGAFQGCAFKSITIPEGVTTIDASAFQSCQALETVTFHEGLTTIGKGAFYFCDSLKSISIPASVTTIGEGAFELCDSLESVYVPCSWDNNPLYSGFGSALIIADHSIEDGVCSACGCDCPHKNYTDSKCDDCGYECTHESYTDGKCDDCGYECPHDSYTDGVCDNCGYGCAHENITDGKCDDCGYECAHEGQNGSCQVCGANLGKLVIDVTDGQDVNIGTGYEYYDEDGYIITGTNLDASVLIYEPADLTFRDATFAGFIIQDAPENSVFNITLEGTTEITGVVSMYKEHLIFDGDEAAIFKAPSLCASGFVTVNGGNIVLDRVTDINWSTIGCDGGFTINGGTVTASNNYFYVVNRNVTLNGGELNIISTSTDYAAMEATVTMKKGTLLTFNAESGMLRYDSYVGYIGKIVMADGAEENDYFFVRYDTESEFTPVRDINSALDGKTYAEIKIDTHEHNFENSICAVCGYACPHENVTDGKCLDCGAEGTFVTIEMTDSYGDGWNGNAVVIKQFVDGVFTEVETATIENGGSGTFTTVLSKDGIFALSWLAGDYPSECSFTIAVDGETVYECSDGSTLTDGQMIYVICEHTSYTDGKCDVCGYECTHEKYTDGVCDNCDYECPHDSYTDGACDNCEYACPHENVTGATCITPVECDVCGYSVFDWTNHEGEYVTVWFNDYQHVSEYECCHIGSSVVYEDHDYKDYTITTPADCVNNAWETGKCICGDTHTREIAGSAKNHDWSNLDGVCANGCGAECPHDSYTNSVCDKCGYECPHTWDEGVLTRPVYDAVLGSKDGYYTYTCMVCAKEKKETVKSADYSAYEAVSEEINALLQSDELTNAAKQAIYSAANECGLLSNDLTEREQNIVDDLVAELEKIVADADEKIASGEYVKADYNGIYQAIHRIKDKFFYEDVTDEGKAGLEEIKKRFEAMKADENTSAADVAEFEKEIEAYEEELDKGIEDGTLVSVRPEKIATKFSDNWNEKLEAEGLLDERDDFINNQKFTDEALAAVDEIENFLVSLEGTVAENAENLAKLNEMFNSVAASWENCLRGTHNFKDYEITSPAKCGENAVETSTCWFCGETDEREVEGSALEHSFTKYEETEAPKCGVAGKEVAYCDHGCQTTDEREIPALEHIFLDYVSNGDATCTSDGTKTAECANGCGATDTVADEGTKLNHIDEDGDKICDDCGSEVEERCDICGGKAHGGNKLQLLFCLITTIIRFVISIFKTIN